MLQGPKKIKQGRRRPHRGRSDLKGKATKGTNVSFGEYGLKATTGAEVTARQIEAARRTIARYTKRVGKTWIRIFPQKSLTRKASEVPMGSGKGSPEMFVAVVKPGRVLFEIAGVDKATAMKALNLAAAKLPVQCRFVDVNEIY